MYRTFAEIHTHEQDLDQKPEQKVKPQPKPKQRSVRPASNKSHTTPSQDHRSLAEMAQQHVGTTQADHAQLQQKVTLLEQENARLEQQVVALQAQHNPDTARKLANFDYLKENAEAEKLIMQRAMVELRVENRTLENEVEKLKKAMENTPPVEKEAATTLPTTSAIEDLAQTIAAVKVEEKEELTTADSSTAAATTATTTSTAATTTTTTTTAAATPTTTTKPPSNSLATSRWATRTTPASPLSPPATKPAPKTPTQPRPRHNPFSLGASRWATQSHTTA